VHDDVHAAPAFEHSVDDGLAAFGGRDVRANESVLRKAFGTRARRGEDVGAALEEARDDGSADALGATGDERTAPF